MTGTKSGDSDAKTNVTDLDVLTAQRAEAFNHSTPDEMNLRIPGDSTGDSEKLMEVKRQSTAPVTPGGLSPSSEEQSRKIEVGLQHPTNVFPEL
jgi:hypothetical protein